MKISICRRGFSPPLPEESKRGRETDRPIDTYTERNREREGAGERQRKGLEWGNSNYILDTKGLEKLH